MIDEFGTPNASLNRRAQPWLGTIVEIAVPDACGAILDLGFAEIARVHALMSFHDEGSDLARLRRASLEAPVELDFLTVCVLREAKLLWDLSDGLFDVSIAPLLVRWGYLPQPEGVDPRTCAARRMEALDIIDDRHVRMHEPMLIDLGGIAKGFAVDCAVDALKAAGAPCGIVNAGGDLRVFGNLEAPVHLRAVDWSGADGVIALRNSALASSGNFDRRHRAGGVERAPHIGADGDPILSDDLTVVEAPLAVHADALTKIAMASPAMFERLAPRFGALQHTMSRARGRINL